MSVIIKARNQREQRDNRDGDILVDTYIHTYRSQSLGIYSLLWWSGFCVLERESVIEWRRIAINGLGFWFITVRLRFKGTEKESRRLKRRFGFGQAGRTAKATERLWYPRLLLFLFSFDLCSFWKVYLQIRGYRMKFMKLGSKPDAFQADGKSTR